MTSNICFAKGLGLGLVVGSAIGAAMIPHKKPGRKSALGKVLKTVGDVLENVSDSIGM